MGAHHVKRQRFFTPHKPRAFGVEQRHQTKRVICGAVENCSDGATVAQQAKAQVTRDGGFVRQAEQEAVDVEYLLRHADDNRRLPIVSSTGSSAATGTIGTADYTFPRTANNRKVTMTRTSNVVALRPAESEAPTFKNGKVPPKRLPNAALRPREYLTPKEVDRLIEAARKRGRYGPRDATLILLAYRHALRVKELVELEWSSVDFEHQVLHVARAKNGVPSVHPLRGVELRALRQLRKAFPEAAYVCMSERGTR
jgi:integrase